MTQRNTKKYGHVSVRKQPYFLQDATCTNTHTLVTVNAKAIVGAKLGIPYGKNLDVIPPGVAIPELCITRLREIFRSIIRI